MRFLGMVVVLVVAACGDAKVDKVDKNLVGWWTLDQSDADFSKLELRADGTFESDEGIVCVTAPCPSRRDTGTWRSTDFSSATKGKLQLDVDGKPWKKYDVELERGKPRQMRLRSATINALFRSSDV